MPFVDPALTKATPDDLRDLLIQGHLSAGAELPSYQRLGVGWAQVMIEVRRGEAMWNWNAGNLKCFKSCRDAPQNLWTVLPEVDAKEYPFQRAYGGPVEGFAAYWRLIGGKRYASTLPLFDAGKPYEAMMRLGKLGYFEAEPVGYARTVEKLYAEYRRRWSDPNPESWGEKNSTLIVVGAVLVGAATAAYVYTR